MHLRIPPETQPCPCFSHQPSIPSFALGSTRRREASMPAFNRRSRKIDAYKRKPCRKHHIISHPTCLFLPFKTKSSNIKLPTFTKVLYNLCSLFSTRTWPQTFQISEAIFPSTYPTNTSLPVPKFSPVFGPASDSVDKPDSGVEQRRKGLFATKKTCPP